MFVEDIYINDAKEYAYLIETCRSVETHKEVPFSPLHASPHTRSRDLLQMSRGPSPPSARLCVSGVGGGTMMGWEAGVVGGHEAVLAARVQPTLPTGPGPDAPV